MVRWLYGGCTHSRDWKNKYYMQRDIWTRLGKRFSSRRCSTNTRARVVRFSALNVNMHNMTHGIRMKKRNTKTVHMCNASSVVIMPVYNNCAALQNHLIPTSFIGAHTLHNLSAENRISQPNTASFQKIYFRNIFNGFVSLCDITKKFKLVPNYSSELWHGNVNDGFTQSYTDKKI